MVVDTMLYPNSGWSEDDNDDNDDDNDNDGNNYGSTEKRESNIKATAFLFNNNI